jgi:hypothetical protein
MQRPLLQFGARIRQISEDQTKLLFECEDDSTLDVTIVEPGQLRDHSGQEQSGEYELLLSGSTSIYRQSNSGDPLCLGRGEKQRAMGYVLGSSQTRPRRSLQSVLVPLFGF